MIVIFSLLTILSISYSQDGGVNTLVFDREPSHIYVDATFYRYSDQRIFGGLCNQPDHINIIKVKYDNIVNGDEAIYEISQRCKIRFKLSDKSLQIFHHHDIYSDTPLIGVLRIRIDGRSVKINLNKCVLKIKPFNIDWKLNYTEEQVFKFNYLAGKFGSGPNSFMIGRESHFSDSFFGNIYLQTRLCPVDRNCKLKISFDYLEDKGNTNQLQFSVKINERMGLYDYRPYSNLLKKDMKKFIDNKWHKYKTIVRTPDYSESIGFEFYIPVEGDDFHSVFLIDNFKVESIDTNENP